MEDQAPTDVQEDYVLPFGRRLCLGYCAALGLSSARTAQLQVRQEVFASLAWLNVAVEILA